jgi:hypothetical protein
MAAAGLWTTPTDLARYAIGVQRAVAGESKLLTADMAGQMLTLPLPSGTHGLGPGVGGSPGKLQFSHGGRNEGFDATLIAYAHSGQGAVVMINGNDNSRMMGRIFDYIARRHRWPDSPPAAPAVTRVRVPPAELAAIVGRYDLQNGGSLTLISVGDRLFTETTGLPDEEFVPTGAHRFVSGDRPVSFRVVKSTSGEAEALEWTTAAGTRRLPRVR